VTVLDRLGRLTGRFEMSKALVAIRRRGRDQRGAATAEYAIATVAACGFGGILIALLKSSAVQVLLKAIINYALRAAGLDGVQL
jgi:GTP cyclohydrolase II